MTARLEVLVPTLAALRRATPRWFPILGVGLGLALGCGGLGGSTAPEGWMAYSACRDGQPDCEMPEAPTNEIRMGMILGSPRVSDLLREEGKVHDDAHIRLNQRMKGADDVSWALDPESGPAKLRAALTGIDPVLADILAYAAVRSAPAGDGEWGYLLNSDGEDACGRGPLKLTYRQAKNLGLTAVQPDAVVRVDLAESDDLEAKLEAIAATTTIDEKPPILEGVELAEPSAEVKSGRVCLFVDGPDERADVAQLAVRLAAALGPDVESLPPSDDPRALAARLAKLYASDFPKGFSELRFDKDQDVRTLLANQSVGNDAKDYVIGNMAHAIGSSAALVCIGAADDPALADPQLTGCEEALKIE